MWWRRIMFTGVVIDTSVRSMVYNRFSSLRYYSVRRDFSGYRSRRCLRKWDGGTGHSGQIWNFM